MKAAMPRRMTEQPLLTKSLSIQNSRKAYLVFRPLLTADVEEVWAMALASNKQVQAVERIFRGTVDACLVHPRDIFRFACMRNASSLIVAHNHPSDDLVPSEQDLQFTKRLILAGQIMEIPILDHLILTRNSYASLADLRYFDFTSE